MIPTAKRYCSLVFDNVPLLNGVYHFNIAIYGSGTNDLIQRREGCGNFRIVGTADGERGQPATAIVELPHRWNLTSEDETDRLPTVEDAGYDQITTPTVKPVLKTLPKTMSQAPIHFVISAPRSGSTWLTTALNEHPDIFATEHRLFGDFCEVWQNNDGSTMPRITFDKYAAAFSQHYFYQSLGMNHRQFMEMFQRSFVNFLVNFAKRRTEKSIVIDKITPYPGTASMVVEQIRSLFPNSKIIQLVRDGRDVLTSGTFDWLLKDAQGTDRHQFFVDKKPDMTLNRFFDEDVIKKWGNNWRETIDAFSDAPADLQITYENLKANFDQEIGKVFDIVEASPATNDEIREVTFEQMSGRKEGDSSAPTAKARKGIVGDWKNHFTSIDGQQFDACCGDALIQMGYESDREWLAALPETLAMRQP